MKNFYELLEIYNQGFHGDFIFYIFSLLLHLILLQFFFIFKIVIFWWTVTCKDLIYRKCILDDFNLYWMIFIIFSSAWCTNFYHLIFPVFVIWQFTQVAIDFIKVYNFFLIYYHCNLWSILVSHWFIFTTIKR